MSDPQARKTTGWLGRLLNTQDDENGGPKPRAEKPPVAEAAPVVAPPPPATEETREPELAWGAPRIELDDTPLAAEVVEAAEVAVEMAEPVTVAEEPVTVTEEVMEATLAEPVSAEPEPELAEPALAEVLDDGALLEAIGTGEETEDLPPASSWMTEKLTEEDIPEVAEMAEPVEEEIAEVAEAVEVAEPVMEVAEIAVAEPVEEIAYVAPPVVRSPQLAETLPEVVLPWVPAAPILPTPPAVPAAPVARQQPPVMPPPVVPSVPTPSVEAGPLAPCEACGSARKPNLNFCEDCGYMFPEDSAIGAEGVTGDAPSKPRKLKRVFPMPNANVRLNNRYEIREMLGERQGLARYSGIDHGVNPPQPVTIVMGHVPQAGDPFGDAGGGFEDEIMPTFDDDIGFGGSADKNKGPAYPSIAWEKEVLSKAKHAALPSIVEQFADLNYEYLVTTAPAARNLWDMWDEPEYDSATHYTWLIQIAAGMDALHSAGAMLEALRPDIVGITPQGQVVFTDLGELLPLPLTSAAQVKGTLYTAPELILAPHTADARAALYSFGAMLYSLEYLHHTLEEKDFEKPYQPKQISDRFPDVHPLFLRLINKTFCRDINTRFPTDEASKVDATGFKELIKTLGVCKRSFDLSRLDIACWSTTGMVRTGNEDAFTVLHGTDWRQDDLNEYAMVLLADGMGGYEAGEIAAAMAMNELRKYLVQRPMFSGLFGYPPAEPINVEALRKELEAALRHVNKEVFTASRDPKRGRRGMGCTAEAVYVDTKNVIVGHVGDSRVYHLHQGRLIQLTRDQTLVHRLVELGQLSEEEAENHPRKNELQQAIGGQPDVSPGSYSGKLKRGDWVLVCSDGLTNHISNKELEQMLTRETNNSAEEAARRLLNLVNLRGATDNATVVVIRAS